MDWLLFLQDNNIDYVTKGPNTKHGEVSVKCPWCGPDDPSFHLGISLSSEKYGCWRNINHSGKKPHRLVQAILGCSNSQASIIVEQYSGNDPENLDQAFEILKGIDKEQKQEKKKKLKFPSTFTHLMKENSYTAKRFRRYFERRGFNNLYRLDHHYKIRFCTTGKWKDRIIIPIFEKGKLVCWTGRALQNPTHAPRYRALSETEGAIENINNLILDEDYLAEGGGTLFVTEGPFDAMKIDHYGRGIGAYATCIFGTQMSLDQAYRIVRLSKVWDNTIILFDPEAIEATFNAHEILQSSGIEIGQIPDGIEDPGAMTEKQVLALIHEH